MFYRPKLGCSVCGNGLVAFVVAADGKRLLLFCIQCGTWYASIEHHDYQLVDSTATEGPDLQLAGCDCSVRFPPARWATAEEVRAYGWGDYLDPEPNPWSPEQAWSEAEWAARLRGVDVWAWNAVQKKQPPQAEEPAAEPPRPRLLDPYGKPFAEPGAADEQPGRRLLDPYGRPFAEPGAAPDRGGI